MPTATIRVRLLALVVAVGLLASLVAFASATPAEATHDCPGITRSHEYKATGPFGDTYWMGAGVQKADSSCNDLNLVWVKNDDYYRGQYLTSSGYKWSDEGRVWLWAGNQSPWAEVVTNIIPTTYIRAGNRKEHKWYSGSKSEWRY